MVLWVMHPPEETCQRASLVARGCRRVRGLCCGNAMQLLQREDQVAVHHVDDAVDAAVTWYAHVQRSHQAAVAQSANELGCERGVPTIAGHRAALREAFDAIGPRLLDA